MGAYGYGVFDNDRAMDYAGTLHERLQADIDAALALGDDATALAALHLLGGIWSTSPFCAPDRPVAVAWLERFRSAIETGGWLDVPQRLAEVDAVVDQIATLARWQSLPRLAAVPSCTATELVVATPGMRGFGDRRMHLTTATLNSGTIWSTCQRRTIDASRATALPVGYQLTRAETCGWCWKLERDYGHLTAQHPLGAPQS